MLTMDELVGAVREVVRPEDDIVVVHSGLWSFGEDALSPEAVIRALLEAVGPRRTLVMPAFTLDFPKTGTFHWQETPSGMGVISEAFRQWPGAVRSRNPMNSWTALGPLQEDVRKDTGRTLWGPGTPFEYLYVHNARIVCLGSPLADSGSVVHMAEESEKVPYRFFKTFRGTANFGDGYKPVSARMYARRLDLPTTTDFSPVVEGLREEGKLVSFPLGRGRCEVSSTRDIVDAFKRLLASDPLAGLKDKKAYEAEVQKPLFCFASPTNVDILSSYFKQQYQAITGEESRMLNIPFDQYRQQLLDEEADLRVCGPNYVVFLETPEHLLGDLIVDPLTAPTDERALSATVDSRMREFAAVLGEARRNLKGAMLVLSLADLRGSALGMADRLMPNGTRRMIDIANKTLAKIVEGLPGAYFIDLDEIVRKFGASKAVPGKYGHMARIPFGREFSIYLSKKLTGVVLALEGRTARVLILDLDNTLWKGVAGEEGIAGIDLGPDYPGNVFRDFQRYLKALSRRGIALAVCSKNTEELAIDVMDHHPQMVLRSDEFAVLRINWDTKDKSVRDICTSIGLGLNNACFIDDNPAERDWVRGTVPGLLVPELPEDPADWIEFLADYPYLENLSLTKEDLQRTQSYRAIRTMEEEKKSFSSMEDFYHSLQMVLYISAYSKETRARILQLIAKTNQFNTTTLRVGQQDLEERIAVRGTEVFSFGIKDRHTERETIGLVMVTPVSGSSPRAAEIDVFLMSCRVLGRGVETGVLAWLTQRLKERGTTKVRGKILPTPRNLPSRNLYSDRQFQKVDDVTYELDLSLASIALPSWLVLDDSEVRSMQPV